MADFRHFRLQRKDDVLVVHLVDPKLFDTLIVTELQDELVDLMDTEKPKKVLVNFGGVTHCSTAVINGLLRAKKRVVTDGGQLKLCQMKDTIREAYRMLNLDGTVFEIHDTLEKALAAF